MSEVNHAERAHSSLGASSMERWSTCPASVGLSAGLPNPSSPYAKFGTIAHEIVELALLAEKDPAEWIGKSIEPHKEIVVDEEMADAARVYTDYITKQGEGKEVSLEERVSLEYIREGMFGTSDAFIYEPFGTLEVVDFKYGKGIPVEAVENKQMLYYALGSAQGCDFSSVKLTIVQPRADHPDGPIRSWVITPERLKEFEKDIRKAVEATEAKEPKFQPSDKGCKWCLAKSICPALKGKALALAKDQFADEVELPKADVMTPEEISKTLKNASLIKAWVESVEKHAKVSAESGVEIEGFKLVKAKKNRKWTDEKALVKEFGDLFDESDLYAPRKLKTPAALEKIVGKADVARFSETPEGGLTLVKDSDKRAKVVMKAIEAKEQFDDEFDI